MIDVCQTASTAAILADRLERAKRDRQAVIGHVYTASDAVVPVVMHDGPLDQMVRHRLEDGCESGDCAEPPEITKARSARPPNQPVTDWFAHYASGGEQ